MTTKLEKMAEEEALKDFDATFRTIRSKKDYPPPLFIKGYSKGAEAFQRMVLEYLVSPISDCYLEQRESLSRQEVIDLLEGISDKIKELGKEEI